jgi:hypothetical protein
MKTTATTTPSAMIAMRIWESGGRPSQPSMADGMLARMLAKISSEMPLPTPRWVISSPSHITRVVPAVSVTTIR